MGEIPEGWEGKKGKYLFSIVGGFAPNQLEIEDGDAVYFKVDDLNRQEDGFYISESNTKINFASSELYQEKLILFPKRGEAINTNKVKITNARCIFDTNLMGIKVDETIVHVVFLTYCILARRLDDIADKTTIPQINNKHIYPLVFPFPSLQEQTTIATYLDRKTQQIDRLIEIKQKQIELLKEQRTAIINQAVTKGLNPDVPMKDSGIEWLGEIPRDWEVKKIKFLCSFKSGGTPPTDNLDYWNGDIPWVSSKDMKKEFLDDTQDHITEKAVQDNTTKLIPKDTMLMVVRSGILRHAIPVAITMRDLTINQDLKGIIPNKQLHSVFLCHLIQGMNHIFLTLWGKQGATVESLEHEYYTNTKIPLPSIHEQKEITEFVKNKKIQIDQLTESTQTQINQLKEYRTALISEVVTGKIDVRN